MKLLKIEKSVSGSNGYYSETVDLVKIEVWYEH